jgi:hypothetical protein
MDAKKAERLAEVLTSGRQDFRKRNEAPVGESNRTGWDRWVWSGESNGAPVSLLDSKSEDGE